MNIYYCDEAEISYIKIVRKKPKQFTKQTWVMFVGEEESDEAAMAHFKREPARLLKFTGEKKQEDVQNPSLKLKHKCKDLGKAYTR
jgi:ribosomal protein S21